jgi:hypothetical protein
MMMDRSTFLSRIPQVLPSMALHSGWAAKHIYKDKIYYSISSRDMQDFLNRLGMLKPLIEQDSFDHPDKKVFIEADGYRPQNQRIFSGDLVNMLNNPDEGRAVRDYMRSRIEPIANNKAKFSKSF